MGALRNTMTTFLALSRRAALLLAGTAFLGACAAAAPPRTTRWAGVLGPGPGTRIEVEERGSQDRTARFMDLGQAGMPVLDWVQTPDSLSFRIPTPSGQFTFSGAVAAGVASGRYAFGPLEGPFTLDRAASRPPRFTEHALTIESDTVRLAATLLMPNGRGPFAAAVGLHGSGPETRAGAGRYLAEELASLGIAVLLYDKRGSGESTGDWRSATPQDLASDAVAAFQVLRARPGVDAGRIGLVGASQASWIAAVAGERLARNGTPPGFLIIRSGPLTTPAEEGNYDYEVRLRGAGFGEREIEEARALLVADDEVTRSGGGDERLRVMVGAAAGTAWFRAMEYVPEPGGSPGRIRFRPWLDLDPAPLLRQLPAPGLWLYGSADETVPALASSRIAEQLRSAGQDYDIVVIGGADHALMRPNPQGGPWPVLAPEYLQHVRAWVCRRGIALVEACATPPPPRPASPT